MRVVGYGRWSTDRPGTACASGPAARRSERCRQQRLGDAWLADEGVSGAVSPEERKRFKAALALLEAREVEALIFTEVDRASRCTENFARLIRLRGAGLAVDRRRDGHRHSYSDRQGDGALGGGLR
jgi:DNA invertase Pin-like site-specific DNA recombinase